MIEKMEFEGPAAEATEAQIQEQLRPSSEMKLKQMKVKLEHDLRCIEMALDCCNNSKDAQMAVDALFAAFKF